MAVNAAAVFDTAVVDPALARPGADPWVRWTRTGDVLHAVVDAVGSTPLDLDPASVDLTAARLADPGNARTVGGGPAAVQVGRDLSEAGDHVDMLLRLLLRIVVVAAIIGVATRVVPGVHVYGGFGAYLWVAVLLSVVNAILGPVLHLISLPLTLLTLGVFLLVINAALLAVTAGLTSHLNVDSFGAAVAGGLVIAVLSWLAEVILPLRSCDR